MAGRGPQTFLKRQKEQQRKEKQMEKMERRLQRNKEEAEANGVDRDIEVLQDQPHLDRLRLD